MEKPDPAFQSAISRINKAVWKSVRELVYNVPEIPDGTYKARLVSASCGVTRTQPTVPWLRLGFEIVEGPCTGMRPAAFLRMYDPRNPQNEVPMNVLLSQLSVLGFNVAEIQPEDMPEVAETLRNLQPLVELWLRTRVTANGQRYQDVRVNRVLAQNMLK